MDKIYDMVQNLEHVIQQHPDFEDYDKSIIMASLGQLKDDIAAGDLKESAVQEGHYPHIKSFDKLYGINDMQRVSYTHLRAHET